MSEYSLKPSMTTKPDSRDTLYEDAVAAHGASLARLARAYEADPEIRRDLLQEIHLAMWRSLDGFDGRCSLRTWVFRVAHNVATSHVLRQKRGKAIQWVTLDDPGLIEAAGDLEKAIATEEALERLKALILRLEPLDRKVIVSYLEGLDGVSISEITGISPSNVATKIHRVKRLLSGWFQKGGRNE